MSYISSPDAATKRDLRLDLLRGFSVVVMVADHIGGESSWLYVINREGLTSMLSRVMRRAGFLYLLTVSMTIAFSIVSMWLNTPCRTTSASR